MLNDMILMGFEREVALFALKKTQYESEDRAIAYLQDRADNGKYEHDFVEFGQNKELCMLCMESVLNH